MTTAEAMETIETPQFCAYVNVASSFKTFLRRVIPHEAVKALIDQSSDQSVAKTLLSRILKLLQFEPEEGLEHSWDASIAAYLWILGEKHEEFAKIAAEAIRKGQRLWWAKQVADKVLEAEIAAHSRQKILS